MSVPSAPHLFFLNKLRLSHLAVVCALAYTLAAGFRTLSDFDVWWQLAAGRHWFTTGHLARQEIFSYTVPGTPWTYPAGAGLIFYALFRLGGYALVSLLAPMAAAGIVALLLRRGGLLRAWTVVLGVPIIVWRTTVRAELFTTVLTAAFLVLLWEHSLRSSPNRKAPLWSLPLLMAAWVNLHPGFVLGLGLVALFLARAPKTLAPWAILTALATLINPWGWRIYAAVLEQWRALRYQHTFIAEWLRAPLSWESASDAFRLRDPNGGYWLLLALAAAAGGMALWRRKFVGVLLLVGAALASLWYFRFQALFAITAAVILPDVLARPEPGEKSAPVHPNHWGWIGQATATVALAALVMVRVTDLATNRYYLASGELAAFGAGVAGWFPERALRFVEQRKLPREIYHDYHLGGFLAWRLWPAYRVFVDGRALPFGPALFFLQQRLGRLGPESPEWQQTLNHWKIHTLVVSTARFGGFGALPLKNFCDSDLFDLAYLDETAAVFVRREDTAHGPGPTPSRLSCGSARFPPPPPTAPAAERFHFWANAGKLYYALERDAEAERAWEQARQIFDGDPSLHLDLGQLRHTQGRLADAEREFRRAIALRPSDTAWYALGDLLASEGRHLEAAECFRRSAARSSLPHESYRALGRSYRAAGQPRQALAAFDRALRSSPFRGPAESLGRGFTARTLAGRAVALLSLRNAPAAVADLERATALDPLDGSLHLALAVAYLADGRAPQARQALARARELGASGPAADQIERQFQAAPPR